MGLEGNKFNRRDFLKITAGAALAAGLNSDMPEKLEQKKTPPTEIEKRFGSRMEIGGNMTETIDIVPETPSEKIAMLVAPGFNASIHTNAPMLEQLAGEGRRVLSINHPHAGRDVRVMDVDVFERAARYPMTELRKASNLLDYIDAKGIEKVDCFAFSEGALNTLLAAYMHPEKFNSIVLSAPAGLIGEDSLWSVAGMWDPEARGLIQRFQSQSKTDNTIGKPSVDHFKSAFPEVEELQNRIEAHMAATWKEDEEDAGRHKLATFEDLRAIANMRIDDLIAFARAAGVKIAVLSGIDDQVFPASKMAGKLDETTGEITPGNLHKGQLDGFMTTIGAHGPHYSARVVNYLFDRLDEKRARESTGN